MRAESTEGKARVSAGRRRRWLALALAPALGLAACDMENLLEVDLPGQVTEGTLDDPRQAQTLTNSVIGDVECAWNNYVAAASHHSDEWIQSSGNATMKRWGQRDITPTFDAYASGGCDANYGLFTPMHTARYQAETNYERVMAFPDDQVPGKPAMLARIRAYGALPYVAFAEGFCGTPLDGSEKVYTSRELFAIAEERFTEALQLAQQANLADLRSFALVGRARARLGQEDYAGAIEDASQVPVGFRFVASRDQAPALRQNAQFRLVDGPTAAAASQKHASVAPSYRDVRWKGVKDPRVNVAWDGVSLGFDFTTPHYRHDKYNAFDSPVLIASHREAQMIIAEAAALTGDLARARQILDAFHTAAGIPPLTEADVPTQAAVIRQVIEERRREFFAEGGHRLRDHLRWRGTEYAVPFLGEPGSDHPDGVDHTGQPYGTATCFPIPSHEVP